MQSRLKPDTRIFQDPTFEDATSMLQCSEEAQLTSDQRKAVKKLVICSVHSPFKETGKLSLLDRARERWKLRYSSSFIIYLDNRFITPTSNVCKRLFSLVKYAIGDRRHGVTTENIEVQMFLDCNIHFLNVVDVNAIM